MDKFGCLGWVGRFCCFWMASLGSSGGGDGIFFIDAFFDGFINASVHQADTEDSV